MGFYGCIGGQGHGRNEKQPKKKRKWSCHSYFVMSADGKTKQGVGRGRHGDGEEFSSRNFGVERGKFGRKYIFIVL